MEFLPYPHLIATLFNGCAFGPPLPLTAASAWTRVDHPVSGLHRPIRALLRLGFPPAPHFMCLTHRTVQLAGPFYKKYAVAPLRRFHSLRTQDFRFSFTPLPGSFSPFLHSTLLYRSLASIQAWGVVPPASRRVSRVPRYSGSCRRLIGFAYGAFTLSGRLSQCRSAASSAGFLQSSTPGCFASRFGLLRFRSPLLTESMFLSFPPATEMFQFAGFPSAGYVFTRGWPGGSRPGFPIQTPVDRGMLAPPHGFSQLAASFFGFQCQGIRPVPFPFDLPSSAAWRCGGVRPARAVSRPAVSVLF